MNARELMDTARMRIHGGRGRDLRAPGEPHRAEVLRTLGVRWVELAPIEGRRLLLATASLSVLGYDHDLAEPVIHSWNASVVDGGQETK